MPIDMSKVNLDAPAFGAGAPQTETSETATTEASQAESGIGKENTETQPTSGGTPDVSETEDTEEQRVPYSRHATVVKQRREAEAKLEAAEAELEHLRQIRQERETVRGSRTDEDLQMPEYWRNMYGDNENSRAGWKEWMRGQEAIREEARREAIEAVRNERESQTRATSTNVRVIDERLEDLGGYLGRDLSEKEEGDLLDIIDEYTPKDEDGNYAGDLIPFDKAWEIYELKQSQTSRKSSQRRATPTALTSTGSDGETNTNDKSNADWNPRDWNSWRRRIPN